MDGSPTARRMSRPRWTDGRLLAGVTLLAASVVVGGAWFRAADTRIQVWAAGRPLAAGTTLRPGDLIARPVRLFGADAARYVGAHRPVPPGSRLLRDVGAGELLPVAAVTTARTGARRVVAVPVARAHALGGDVERGMRVDVVATYERTGDRPRVVPVLRAALVVDVHRPPAGFAAGRAELVVLVEVAPADALAVAAAIETAAIDVFRVVPGPEGAGDIGGEPRVVAER